MPYLLRLCATAGLLAGGGQGGWFAPEPQEANFTREQPTNQTLFEAWSDWASYHYVQAAAVGEGWITWASSWGESAKAAKKGLSWDGGLCFLLDSIVGIVCWTVFGNAWPGVKTGFQRAFRVLAPSSSWQLFGCTLLVGFMLACGFAMLGLGADRDMVSSWHGAKGGNWAQRAAGGVPEAAGASFLGPGTGRIPKTSDLRNFKKVGTAEKWVLVRREGRVAVFKVGGDSQTIRTAGLYVPVEPDTWRGDKEIVDACAGHDKVHLCRSLQCGEDGQHFKEYSIAKEFDCMGLSLERRRQGEPCGLGFGLLGPQPLLSALWSFVRSRTLKRVSNVRDTKSVGQMTSKTMCLARTRAVWQVRPRTLCWTRTRSRAAP